MAGAVQFVCCVEFVETTEVEREDALECVGDEEAVGVVGDKTFKSSFELFLTNMLSLLLGEMTLEKNFDNLIYTRPFRLNSKKVFIYFLHMS